MEPAPSVFQALAALATVIGLIFLVAWVLKRFAFGDKLITSFASRKGKPERKLRITEQLWLDARYRVVVIDDHGQKRTLLLGPQQALHLSETPTGYANAREPENRA